MKNHIYTLVAVLMANMAMAQTQPTLTFSGESSGDHIATQSITLSPGFHTTSFSAKIVSDAYIPVAKSDENYIFTRTYQSGMTSSSGISENKDVLESISYFDGLGRPMQQIGIKAAPDKEDIITHIEYDGFGRQDKDWLPYHEPSGTLGTYRGNKASATRSYYKSNYGSDFPTMGNTTANAYSEKDFEPSPLNRVLKQAAPGEDWKMEGSHEIEFGYDTNTTNEVRLFKVTTTFANNTYTPSLVQSGYYTAGELYKNITYDENHSSGTDHSTEEFTDKQGRVVLKRTYDSGAHDTYYVYDDFGNLTYVIPPKVTTASVSATELNELCYQYKYDQRNRLVEKKIPGKGTSTTWEEIVYNKLDQPVLTRDPNLRVQGKWLFTKYDAFGRVAYTGTINNGASRISLQGSANGYTGNLWVGPGTTTIDSRTISYNNSGYPNTNYGELHTVNYYDTYVDTDGLSVPSTVLGQPKATNTQGLATVSKVKVLDTGDWITSITGYDKKGRAIYTASKNDYLVTTDIVETELDFGGKVEQTKATHTKGTNAAIVTVDTFTYDHMGRLLTQKQSINNSAQETLVDNTYDDLGQLVQKEVGGGLQQVDYTYNVRGWLRGINDIDNLGADLFTFKINYNTTESGTNTTQLYNGNISQTIWKTKNDETSQASYFNRSYAYTYDPLNRIIKATYGTKTSSEAYSNVASQYNVSNIGYDKNGNLSSLSRTGNLYNTPMDQLSYTYDSGNKLLKVDDNTTSNLKDEGFKDGANTTTEYTYDTNGNMKTDANKGITGITYNHLNLPTQVTLNSGNISYIYDATGVKLKKTVSTGTTTEYAGNYIYEGGVLQFFNHTEGYVEPNGSSWDYVYQYKDHLGNIRLSYSDDNNNGSIATNEIREENNYYPFGLRHKGYNNVVNGTQNNYMTYNGKELNESLGLNMYEMDLRQYDPAIARWISIDPITHYSASTYNAFDNNPIYFADPSGADSIYNFETGQYVINGTVVSQDEAIAYAQNGGNADGSNNNTANDSESSEDCCGGYVGSYKHVMGPKEKNYYRNNKDKKKVVSKAAYSAGVLATRVSGDLGGDNLGYSGAIRHSYWMYLVAVELGPELAEKLGILHEDYMVTAGKSKGMHNMQTDDSKMDIINNAWGVNLARQNPNLDYLGFEELFFKDATNKTNTTIRILDQKTIPKESLKTRNTRRNKEIVESWKRKGAYYRD